jgi:hypothetical protein
MPRISSLRAVSLLLIGLGAGGMAPGRLDAQTAAPSAQASISQPRAAGVAGVAVRTTGTRPVAVVPLRRLIGRYTIVRHNAAAVPSLLFSDTVSSEVLVNGTLEIKRDGAFKMVYTIRTRLLGDATVSDDRTELTGRITSTSSGITLNVTSNTGEALEEAWPLTAASTAAGRMLTVTFEDGNLEAVLFRRR